MTDKCSKCGHKFGAAPKVRKFGGRMYYLQSTEESKSKASSIAGAFRAGKVLARVVKLGKHYLIYAR